MNPEISEIEIKILDLIEKEYKEKYIVPSIREICKDLEIDSTAVVHGYIRKLKRKGYLDNRSLKSRSFMLKKNSKGEKIEFSLGFEEYRNTLKKIFLDEKIEFVKVPILSKLDDILKLCTKKKRVNYSNEYLKFKDKKMLDIDKSLLDNKAHIIIKQDSDTLKDFGIQKGDLLLFKLKNSKKNIKNLDVVLKVKGDKIKTTLFKTNSKNKLEYRETDIAPILRDRKENYVFGKFISLFRVNK